MKHVNGLKRENYNDGVCEGNAYTKHSWEKRCCGKYCKVNRCFEIHIFQIQCGIGP